MTEKITNDKISRRKLLQLFGAGTVGGVLGAVGANRLTGRWFEALLNSPNNPMQGVQVPAVTHTTASGIRIHNIQTGFVAVKQAHRQYDGPDGRGIFAIATDLRWTEWMPIHSWVIEHPEGIIVVDTGETAAALQPGYYQAGDAFFYGSFLRFALTAEDEIGSQMASLGLDPEAARAVVQTHLHGDHVGGMHYFPNVEFFIGEADYPQSNGALPYHNPDWLTPTFPTFADRSIIDFAGATPLTDAGDVLVVPTPGHSLSHQSVILRDNDVHYFFAGDTSFDEAQLLNVDTAGIVANPAESRQTLRHIQAYCQAFPTVYLPSHDPGSRDRLMAKQVTQVF